METAAVRTERADCGACDRSTAGASSNNDAVVLRRKDHARAIVASPHAMRDGNPQTYPAHPGGEKLIEALSFRQIGVAPEEYAVSTDGIMKMFGVMDLTSGISGLPICDRTPKQPRQIIPPELHSRPLRLRLRESGISRRVHAGTGKALQEFPAGDSLAVGVDRMRRNFGPLKKQVERWQSAQLADASAKLPIYQTFIEDETGFPKHLARRVQDLYFQPIHEEFQPRTMWSLSNPFTNAFKELEPIGQYKATAKLAGFLQSLRTSQLLDR